MKSNFALFSFSPQIDRKTSRTISRTRLLALSLSPLTQNSVTQRDITARNDISPTGKKKSPSPRVYHDEIHLKEDLDAEKRRSNTRACHLPTRNRCCCWLQRPRV